MDKLILPAIHLIALLSFIIYKTKTPFIQFMQKRYQDTFDGLNRSKIQAAEAEKKKRDVEAKLSRLDAEKQSIVMEWKQREAEQVVALKESSARVIAQMKKESEQNKNALEQGFKNLMLKTFSKTVVAQAEAKIKQSLNVDVHHGINQRMTSELSQGGSV